MNIAVIIVICHEKAIKPHETLWISFRLANKNNTSLRSSSMKPRKSLSQRTQGFQDCRFWVRFPYFLQVPNFFLCLLGLLYSTNMVGTLLMISHILIQ